MEELATQKELDVLYQDEHYVAVNKPTGLLVHRTNLASDAEEFALQIVRDQTQKHLYPIHRLDRKTSGVLLFAFSSEAAQKMQETLAFTETQKRYVAIVRGHFPEEIYVDHPLKNLKGKEQEAQTNYRCLKQSECDFPSGKFSTSRYSLIEAFPKTGRMHQIRKHCNHLRHPIIGDRPHGCNKQNKLLGERFGLEQMMLHALDFTFKHPYLKQEIIIKAPLFDEFERMLSTLQLK
ncbi:tRNA pseudouridine65 synthase [Lishizhenia tianjinensis]|uniref:tRNA pseudouridine synthase C n=1 Tax=Lishizhenia tianjinensis TaxID=477690 RepID=A0A1I6XZ37_9FLAO|nr:pseudouridine synthase [Lishizhenia tianjinensis]SFT43609.1 tRNA pseudouridine65 synthase [Lishizhenia tianjinensis]